MPIPAVNRAPKAPEEGELRMLQGEFYWVVKRNGNVYDYDQIEERKVKYVGRLRADETIDTTLPEQAGGRRRSRSRKQRKSRKVSKKGKGSKGRKTRRSQ
jgi:hypothetical protein